MNSDVELPNDLERRLFRIVVEDMDIRLKDLTLLVSLQETELAIMWVTIMSLIGYILVKEYNGK